MRESRLIPNRVFIVYYLALAAFMFILMRPNADPPMLIRMGLFALIFGPAMLLNIKWIPALFVAFLGSNMVSFTHVLPKVTLYFLALAIVCHVIYKRRIDFVIREVFALSYFFICALAHADVGNCFTLFFIAIFLADMIEDKQDISFLLLGFICMSLFLELLFFVHGDAFLQVYTDSGDMERVGWTSPNVFGGAIASGGVLAMAYLTGVLKIPKSVVITYLSIITAILTFIVLSLNASRGALFAFVIPSTLMVLTTKMKWYAKLAVAIAIGVFVYYIVNSYAFEIMMIRMQNESMGTAGGRSGIWEEKLIAFVRDLSPWEQFFGIGQLNTRTITSVHVSTHNDFLTALIAYGFIGFILFVSLIVFLPIKIAKKDGRVTVLLLLTYLLVECFVLEPLFRGYFIEIMFYFFVVKYALIRKADIDLATC